MAKSSKRVKKKPVTQKPVKSNFTLSPALLDTLFVLLIIVLLVILLKPLVIDGLSPQGVDVVGSIGKTHQINEYTKESGERALWNPSIFAGMPIYHRIPAVAWSADNVLQWLGRLTSHVFIYYLFAALGFYLLMRYMQMTPLLSLIGALLFILMPHYKSLYLEGHFAKFSALMFLPWIFLSFKYFLDRRNLLGAALFAVAYGLQIRTQHYQIVFYTGLLIFAVGIYPFIRDLLDKEWKRFATSSAMLAAALILAIGMAAQPLFLAKEYLPYSKRGKTTIDVHQEEGAAQKTDGVSMEYATQWSTHPAEILTWLVPRFYGGMSNENYTGKQYPQLRGKPVSVYWGHMPFTQSYEYMGVLTLLLAVLGLIKYRRNRMIMSLIVFSAFMLLLSFGRHFETFYGFFYHYVPFFNKFRAPMMSVAVTYFIVAIFAVFGLAWLAKQSEEHNDWLSYRTVLYMLGGFFVLGVLIWLYGQGASFIKASGERYQGQGLEMISNIRREYFTNDVIRYIILVLLAGGTMIGYLKKKINFTVLTVILGLLMIGDLILIQKRVSKEYTDRDRIERQYFQKTSTDQFLEKDKSQFRIFPAGALFQDNRWAYYHQTIGGYTPIKMYTIEELVEKNIFNGWDKDLPINWNVLKILNVKYVILQGQVQNKHLQLVHSDPRNKLFTYQFTEYQPRSFFVDSVTVVPEEFERLRLINQPEFDPAHTAILEEAPQQSISAPDSQFTQLTAFTPNRVAFDVYTDRQALLVISEVYYPPGWRIFIDNQAVDKIYKTDHAVQSVVVPEGRHAIEARFEPQSYFRDIWYAEISVGVLYLLIALSAGLKLKDYLSKRGGADKTG